MTSDQICAAFAAKDQEIAALRAALQGVRTDLVLSRDSAITEPGTSLADRLHTSLEAVSLSLGVVVPDRPEAPVEQPPEEPEPAPAPVEPPAPAPAPVEPPAPAPVEPPEPEPTPEPQDQTQPLV